MARMSFVSRRLSVSTLVGSLALAVPLASAPGVAHAAAPIKLNFGKSGPKKMRLVMKLTAKTTTDSAEPQVPLASNSEDEIFYGLSGAREVAGKEVTLESMEVRPSGSRDIWEMGPNSNKTLTRTLFEGPLSSKDLAVLTVSIGEQDNAQRDAIKKLIEDLMQMAGDAIEKELETENTYDVFKGSTKEDIVADTMTLIRQMGKRNDQVVGVFSLAASRDKLDVTANGKMFSKVTSKDGKSATLKLSGFGGSYTVELRLEEATGPRPETAVFLSEEYDKCSEAELAVGGKVVKKGRTVGIKISDRRFKWRCGGSLEWATAPAPTNWIDVVRSATDRDVTWRCFHKSRPDPDYTW